MLMPASSELEEETMRRRFYKLAAMVLAPMITVGCGEDDPVTPEGDTDTDTDADSDSDSDADTDVDYGVPSIRYLLSGTVTNATTGRGVQGIELEFQGITTSSSEGGAWSFDTYDADYCADDCRIGARDVDGEDNGTYQEQTVVINPVQTMGHSPEEGIYEQFDIGVMMTRLDPEDTSPPEDTGAP
jgi:hypothetical protein